MNRRLQHFDGFDMACSLFEVEQKMKNIFGEPLLREESTPLSDTVYDQPLVTLKWRWYKEKQEMDISVRGYARGPVRLMPLSLSKEKEREWRNFRKKNEVDSVRIMRKILWKHINEDKVATLDKSIKLYLRVFVFISAMLAFAPTFSLPRASLSVLFIVYYLVQEYADREKAMDIRLFIVATRWVLLVQGVILTVLGLPIVFALFTFPDPIWRVAVVIPLAMVGWFVLELTGGAPRTKAEDKWKYLTSHLRGVTTLQIKSSVDQAALSLANWSKFFLLAVVSTAMYAVAFYDVGGNTVVGVQILAIVIILNVMIMLDILRKIRGSSARVLVASLARDVPEYPKAVQEVADEKEDWERYNSSLWPF
jgi:hypothetical protein